MSSDFFLIRSKGFLAVCSTRIWETNLTIILLLQRRTCGTIVQFKICPTPSFLWHVWTVSLSLSSQPFRKRTNYCMRKYVPFNLMRKCNRPASIIQSIWSNPNLNKNFSKIASNVFWKAHVTFQLWCVKCWVWILKIYAERGSIIGTCVFLRMKVNAIRLELKLLPSKVHTSSPAAKK